MLLPRVPGSFFWEVRQTSKVSSKTFLVPELMLDRLDMHGMASANVIAL
jgi:hypothetical protein